MSYYYHYTDEKGFNGIKESNEIKPSLNVHTDALLGQGVYFSQKPPQTSTENLVYGNYGQTDSTPLEQRTQYYVRIPASQIGITESQTQNGRNIHVVNTTAPLDLNEYKVKFGERKRYN